jgi:HK97 family phage prohead protease
MTDRLHQLVAACEWKSADDAAGSGELTGYMSVFDTLDRGGDVVQRGAFKKSFSDWSHAKSPMPLISDHEISTSGVIGSVVHLAEDDYGARIRARFSSIAKAQNIRQLMLEQHLNGLSFSYTPVKFHRGTFRGEPARFLTEVKVYEASVVVMPMNEMAVASAKAGPGVDDVHEIDRQLAELESWSRRVEMEQALSGLVENPDSAMYALGVMQETRLRQDLAKLEAWAAAQPPGPSDAERAAARRRDDWDRRNRDSFALRDVMDRLKTAPPCGHGCAAGMCRY